VDRTQPLALAAGLYIAQGQGDAKFSLTRARMNMVGRASATTFQTCRIRCFRHSLRELSASAAGQLLYITSLGHAPVYLNTSM
jgi:hypothetical protein